MTRIVVIGASAAGTTVVDELITLGYAGDILLASAEDRPPYHRPALPKQVLAGVGGKAAGSLPAVPAEVDFRPGTVATNVDVAGHTVTLRSSDGSAEHVEYEQLVIATGSRPRRLLAPATGALALRTAQDAEEIAARLTDGVRAAIVGAGFLGLELATAARARGACATVIDREPPLARLFGPEVSAFVAGRAAQSDVEIILEPGGVLPDQAAPGSLRLSSGRSVPADVIIEAVGDLPCTEWLRDSAIPLTPDEYVITDANCRAADDVVAIGDVRVEQGPSGVIRRPYWFAAIADGRRAAETLLRLPSAATPSTYFWTEVFGSSIRAFGSLPVRGDPRIVVGGLDEGGAVLSWDLPGGAVTVAAVDHPMSTRDLRRTAASPAR